MPFALSPSAPHAQVTPTGFDDLLRCSTCDFAANVEKATSIIPREDWLCAPAASAAANASADATASTAPAAASSAAPKHTRSPQVASRIRSVYARAAAAATARGYQPAPADDFDAPQSLNCHVLVPIAPAEASSSASASSAAAATPRLALVFTPPHRDAQPLAFKELLSSWCAFLTAQRAKEILLVF